MWPSAREIQPWKQTAVGWNLFLSHLLPQPQSNLYGEAYTPNNMFLPSDSLSHLCYWQLAEVCQPAAQDASLLLRLRNGDRYSVAEGEKKNSNVSGSRETVS